MELNLLEFNRYFRYYWWLVKRMPRWEERSRTQTWGMENRWPTRSEMWQQRWQPTIEIFCDGERINLQDYPSHPLLNRKCHEGYILETILAEYDTLWPRRTHLELYFRVYHSITNRIIVKITGKGLEDTNNEAYVEENVAQAIASYLPSGLPVDKDVMKNMAKKLLERRKKKRLEGEAQLQKEKDLMELGQCLICRGIELVLRASELKDDKNLKTDQGNTINDVRKTNENSNGKKRGRKRRRSEVDKGWANRMVSVKLIYLKVQEF
jgi:hypothetical protein